MRPLNGSRLFPIVVFVTLLVAACGPNSITIAPTPTPTPAPFASIPHNQSLAELEAVLTAAGRPAYDLLYACLLEYYQQGIPLSVAVDLCSPKVVDTGEQGFGGPFGNIGGGNIFDPGTITASCSSGDPTRAEFLSGLITDAHEKYEYFKSQDEARRAAAALLLLAKEAGDPDRTASAEGTSPQSSSLHGRGGRGVHGSDRCAKRGSHHGRHQYVQFRQLRQFRQFIERVQLLQLIQFVKFLQLIECFQRVQWSQLFGRVQFLCG